MIREFKEETEDSYVEVLDKSKFYQMFPNIICHVDIKKIDKVPQLVACDLITK